MSDTVSLEPATPPDIARVQFSDLTAALASGWRDFTRAPLHGMFLAAFFVVGGLLIVLQLEDMGRSYSVIPLAFGFPLLGPFLAMGLYDISRRLERGEALAFSSLFRVVWRQKDRQCPSMAAVIVVIFLFWVFIAHMIFALFLGFMPMTNISTDWGATLFTANGLTMLVVGTAVGAALAFVLYAITVMALPMLLDREFDFITAMITSFRAVTENLVPMLAWGIFIAVVTFVAMLPGFLGLLVVFPVLGHASWHLYRRVMRYSDA